VRYLAAHILEDNSSAQDPANLSRLGLYITTVGGEVPLRVAERVGGDPLDLVSRITVTPDASQRTVKVSAVTNSADRSEELADTFALEGLAYMIERDRAEVDATIEDLQRQVDQVTAQLDELGADSVTTPSTNPDGTPVTPTSNPNSAQIQALNSQLTELQQQITNLRDQPLPSEKLTTLADAAAIAVTPQEVANIVTGTGTQGSRANQGGNDGTIRPTTPRGPSNDSSTSIVDNIGLRTAVGALFGLFLGIAIAIGLQRLDPRLRSKEDAEEAFGLPVIAEIPNLPKSEQTRTAVLAYDSPRSPTAESYRALRSSIIVAGHSVHPPGGGPPTTTTEPASNGDAGERSAQVIMVTSPGPGEGKTTTAANLAAVIAETGYAVLAINCDFRKPRLHRYLRADDTPRKVLETAVPNVRTITDVVSDSSRLNPAEVVAAQRQVVESARELFDVIVLDTAPLLTTNDATDLLPEADLVVVCCRAGRTTREAANRTIESLRRHNAPVAGCVLVAADEGPAASYYYYYGTHPEREGNGDGRRNGRSAGRDKSAAKSGDKSDRKADDDGDPVATVGATDETPTSG
jgi:Mrp family chromosome partitioning ATPase